MHNAHIHSRLWDDIQWAWLGNRTFSRVREYKMNFNAKYSALPFSWPLVQKAVTICCNGVKSPSLLIMLLKGSPHDPRV